MRTAAAGLFLDDFDWNCSVGEFVVICEISHGSCWEEINGY